MLDMASLLTNSDQSGPVQTLLAPCHIPAAQPRDGLEVGEVSELFGQQLSLALL